MQPTGMVCKLHACPCNSLTKWVATLAEAQFQRCLHTRPMPVPFKRVSVQPFCKPLTKQGCTQPLHRPSSTGDCVKPSSRPASNGDCTQPLPCRDSCMQCSDLYSEVMIPVATPHWDGDEVGSEHFTVEIRKFHANPSNKS